MKRDKSNRAWATRPRAAWPAFLADALRNSLQRHESLRRQCAKRSFEGPIHDLRVETRRQLALTVLAGEACRIRTDKIRQSLKRYLRNTAKLRDAQVQLAHVDQMMVGHPEFRALHRRLRRLVGRRMRATEKKLGRRRKKLHRRIQSLSGAMRVLSATGQAAPEIIRALRTAFIEARKRASVAEHGGKQLHKARLALKRLRYMAEPLCGIVPGVTAAWINQLHRWQRTMGDIHDLELLTDRMAKHMARRPRLRRLQTAALAKKKRFLRANRARLPAPPTSLRRILAG